MNNLFHGVSGDADERKLQSLLLGANIESRRLLNRLQIYSRLQLIVAN